MRRSNVITDPEFLLEEIELLLRKGQGPCLSVLVNLDGDHTDHIRVKNAVKKAQDLLEIHSIQFATWEAVNERLEFRIASFENTHRQTAIGLFISADMDCIIHFPFKVNEGVVVADSFEVRDVLFLRQYMEPYFVLTLSHRMITLHKGHGDFLQEIRDEIFPMKYYEDHDYGLASKGFESDTGAVVQERIHGPIQAAALQTSKYLNNNGQLLVVGPAKLISSLSDSIIAKHIIATHPGVLADSHLEHASTIMWHECAAARRKILLREIAKLDDLGLLHRAAGIRNVWDAAGKGKGRCLYVERDYQHHAYQIPGSPAIRLHPPKEKYTFIEDAVDDVIERVLAKGGKIIFTEASDLHKFQNIVLVLRYT